MNKQIPKGWKLERLKNIGEFYRGKGIAKNEIVEEGLPCIRYGEIYSEYDYFVKELKSCINFDSAQVSFPIIKNDIIFAASGETLEDIGKCIAYIGDNEAFSSGDTIILRPSKDNSLFLGYLLNSYNVRKQYFKIGQGNAVVHIYSSNLEKVEILLPPLVEQQKIATILSTWDRGIAQQEQLIAEKKVYKQGVMQQLLTGKKRFPGFTDQWKEVKLGDVSEFRRGSFPQPYGLEEWYDDKNGEPFIQVYDVGDNFRIKDKTKRKITKLAASKSVFVPKGSLIITIQGSIGRIAITHYNCYVDRTLLIFTSFHKSINIDFYMYSLFKLFDYEKKIAPGGTIKTITKEVLSSFKLKIPSLQEQEKIASYLSAIDNEIEILEKELEVMHTQKWGLMQQLLTGKVRVMNS